MKHWLFYYPIILLSIFLVFVVAHAIYSLSVPVYFSPPGVEITIKRNIGVKEIANLLEKEGIIRSAFYFKVYFILKNITHQIKPGVYKFEGYYTLKEVAEKLTKGGDIVITFPEGLYLKEIEYLLAKNGLKIDLRNFVLKDFKDKLDFIKFFPENAPLEGFLFPDTYRFFPDETSREVALKFLKNFEKKALPIFLNYPNGDYYQRLILASIIEKEVKTFKERKIVAGILLKRLKIRKPLEVDATIAYAKCLNPPCSKEVKAEDLKINSPYNTYQNYGLPPTPISNPSVDSIKAVFEPETTPYLYYLTTKEGKAIFSQTFQQHRKNIKKYLID